MKAERLVIDSNVWIAALVAPGGTARKLVEAVLDLEIEVLMSESTFAELVSRLERPKFDRYREPESWNGNRDFTRWGRRQVPRAGRDRTSRRDRQR